MGALDRCRASVGAAEPRMTGIKSKAARVLQDDTQDADSKSVAAFVLGSDVPKPTKTATELRQLLAKLEGKEGQHERRLAIHAQLEALA